MTGETDVLIIGAGASGAAVAWRLANAGVEVTCLDLGGWVRPEEMITGDDDWEVKRLAQWHPNPNVRQRPEDYPINQANSPIRPLMFNGVGGSTIMWSCHAPRFHPSDFRVRSLDGVADDWPLTYDDLVPYYELNDRMMGVAGVAGDPANPPRDARQTPPVPPGTGGERLARAFDQLHWHWWPADTMINTQPYGEGRGACNGCGPCELACPHRAKGSVDVTYWPQALRAGAKLVTGANVFEITVDGSGRATGARYYDDSGAEERIAAASVVVAANGIGTPRLLLLSKSTAHPNGLANSSGLVGRNLMHHPIATATGIFDERIDGHRGITACSIFSQEFYETDPARDFVRGYMLQAVRGHGPLLTALGSWAHPGLAWGADHHSQFAEVFGRAVSLAICGEDMPAESNRVTLDPDLRDRHGVPAPALNYRVDENARRQLDHGIASARKVLMAAGARSIHVKDLMPDAGFHLLGTARMGEDPRRSVVDRWGRAHDVPNLFIVDGSVFVTCAALNPTPTIQALALRTAGHIIETRRAAN